MLFLDILWPTFALVTLIFAVWITVAVRRLAYVKRQPPSADAFATGDAMRRYFAPVELANDNLVNLFQMPVLFLALVPLLMITRHDGMAQVLLAWMFVGLRALHSVLHMVVRQVRARFLAHVAANAVLSAMWIGFFVDMVAAAHAYQAAATGLGQP